MILSKLMGPIKDKALDWCIAKSDEIGQDAFVRCLILISAFLGLNIILGALAYIADDPSTVWVVQCWFIYLAHGLARKTTNSRSGKIDPIYKNFSVIDSEFSGVKYPISMTSSWLDEIHKKRWRYRT